ncbi:MAG: hypothetical protein NVS4B7_03460 [Ktedonobacteraceae bacterium]
MASKQLRLDVAQLTDVGRRREHNEDNMAYVIPKDQQVMAKKGALFIVADGMGGHAAGEVASEIAVDTVSNVYYQEDGDDVATSLLQAIKRANALIHQRAAENMLRTGMGTTCVAAVLRGNMAYVANVGDSRAYLVRSGQVKQISQDHSWVGEQVRAGLLTDDQARTHAQRNVITRSLGTQADVDIDLFSEQLEEGDSMILCTDGLSGLISDDEIRRTIDQARPQESVYHLVERANENGGPDNITAIVVSVSEVGVEPPNTRHPVFVGGREVNEDTATAGSSTNGATAPSTLFGDSRTSSSPFRYSSGPLLSPDAVDTAPQPVPQTFQRKRSRLLYPTLALVLLVVMAGITTGAYLFLRTSNNNNVDQTLQNAQQTISKARAATNPAIALQDYASAQNSLRSVQNNSLTASQRSTLTGLQKDLTNGVQTAITQYNTSASITPLPCISTPPVHEISDSTTGTHAKMITLVQLHGKNVLYALGQDSKLYEIDNNSLIPQTIPAIDKAKVLAITGTGSQLTLLTAEAAGNSATMNYSLHVLSPGQTKFDTTTAIDAKFVKDGHIPALMTASGSDVYVLFTLNSAQTSAFVLDYTPNKTHQLSPTTQTIFSVSENVVSMAAFPAHQLFLLLADGSMQSVSVISGSQEATSVLVKAAISQPLPVDAKAFAWGTPVPTAITGGTTSLSIPDATSTNSLAVGTVGNFDSQPHLYIMDAALHRVLDLKVADDGTIGSSTTPATAVTATSTSTGGGVISSTPLTRLQLVKQYTSPTLFAQMKSMAIDSPGAQVNVLTQNSTSTTSLMSFSVSQQNGCQ